MSNKIILAGFGLMLVALTSTVTAAEMAVEAGPAQQPNIIFIMSDDHAANAISSYGGRLKDVFKTPNIDRLATEGMRLNGMYATNSICTPSRAAIMTGQYNHTNGVKTLSDSLDRTKDNLAKRLQGAGYNTAIVGKWHLHTEPSGFDYYNVLPGQGRYHDPKFKEKGQKWNDFKKGGKVYKGYVTDIVTDLGLEWIERQSKDKPFFLMIHHKAPHGLWEPAKRHEKLLEDVKIPEPDSLYNRENHGPGKEVVIDGKSGPQFGSSISYRMAGRAMIARTKRKDWPTGPLEINSFDADEMTSAAYQKYLKDYLRTVAAVDENVGKVLDYLDAKGLTENTIIIYTSDQGMMLGEHDYYDKRWIYEESIQMPFLVRYPGVVPAGTTSDELYLNVDIAPTLLDFAGKPTPETMQGKSFTAGLQDPMAKDGREAIYYRYWMHMSHHFIPAHYGIRTRDHKLSFFYGLALDATGAIPAPTQPYWEYYTLSQDPKEMNNRYHDPEAKAVIQGLKDQLLELKAEIGDGDSKYPELMKVREKVWN